MLSVYIVIAERDGELDVTGESVLGKITSGNSNSFRENYSFNVNDVGKIFLQLYIPIESYVTA